MAGKFELTDTETVEFTAYGAGGVSCVAVVMYKNKYLLHMGTCIIHFPEKPKVTVECLPYATRLVFNDGIVFVEVDGKVAKQIEKLFE